MRFGEAGLLFLLIVPLVASGLMIFGIWLRRRLIARLGTPALVEAQLQRPSPYLRAARGILLLLGLSLLIIAASRPQYGGRIQMLKKRGIDVIVALDFSKSMLAQDVRPSRIERAKLELADFIGRLTGDRVGLVAFAGDTMRFPLTTDYVAATAFWKNLGPYDMPVGGTAIGKALTAGLEMLAHGDGKNTDPQESDGRSKAIILITDGEDHEGQPIEVAEEARKQGVVVFTVGVGSDSPELIPRYVDGGNAVGYQKNEDGNYVTTSLTAENEDALRQIAAKTRGRYFRAGRDLSGMTQVVNAIRNMKQDEVSARQVTVYEEVFQWFLIPAALFLLLAFTLPEGRRTRT